MEKPKKSRNKKVAFGRGRQWYELRAGQIKEIDETFASLMIANDGSDVSVWSSRLDERYHVVYMPDGGTHYVTDSRAAALDIALNYLKEDLQTKKMSVALLQDRVDVFEAEREQIRTAAQ
jgi:hypothetical protein